MATTYGQFAEIEKTLLGNVPTGGTDKVYLYTSGSSATSRLYVKAGNDTQRPLLTNEFDLQDTTNGGLADFTFDGTADVTLSVDPTNATAITAVADGDLLLVADASDSNGLKKITRAHFIESAALDSINIDGGAIDGTPIGANAVSTGQFSTLSASGDFNAVGNAFFEGTMNVTGTAIFVGDVTLGNAASDTINVRGVIDNNLIPSSDDSKDLGSGAAQWKDLYIDGTAYIDDLDSVRLVGAMNCASQAMININVDSGVIDGTVIGGASAAAGTFTAVVGTSLNVSDGNITNVGDIALDTISADDGSSFAFGSNWTAASRTCADLGSVTTADINGGSIDGTVIGAASAAAATVTVLKATSLSGSGDLNVGGAAYFEGAVNVTGTVKVVGDLEVQGNLNSVTVTQNTLEVSDYLIIAGASGSAANMDGGGFMFGGSTLANNEAASLLWDNANTAIDFNIGTTTEIRLENGVLRPETDDDVDLGASGAQWKDLHLDGVAYIDDLRADALGAAMNCASQAMTNINVDSGVIDGTAIGGSSQSTGKFTALSASADLNVVGSAYVEGALGVSGSAQFGDASSDVVTVTAQLTASEGVAFGANSSADMTAGAVDLLLKDNEGAGLEIKQGSDNYLTFRTTNSQEAIVVGGSTCADVIPSADSTVTLGNASYAFANFYTDAIDLQGQGNISMGGTGRIDLDANDNTSIRASADDVITFEVGGTDEFQMSANMLAPSSADGAALGGASNEWSDLYLADSGVIYFGDDQDIQLSHDADAGLTLTQGTDATEEPVLTLKTVGDLAAGAELKFVLDNGAGEGDDDRLGLLSFYGDDSGDAATLYAKITALSEDVTDTEEDGSLTLSAVVAGTMRDIMIVGDITGNSAGVTLPNNSTYGTMKAHSFVTYSDENLKTNIQPVENALDKVKSLKGVTYDWKSDGSSDIGFIAQEVEKVVPQIVKSNGTEGSYAMNYSRVTALLVEGIKEQQAQIESLKKTLASIK